MGYSKWCQPDPGYNIFIIFVCAVLTQDEAILIPTGNSVNKTDKFNEGRVSFLSQLRSRQEKTQVI